MLTVLVVLFAAVMSACGSDPATPGAGTCTRDSECAGTSRCVDGRCARPPDSGRLDARVDRDDASLVLPEVGPPPDRVCAAIEQSGVEMRRPIDAIVFPDESGSMGPARDAVVVAMETLFRPAMEAAGVDYRVIWHGQSSLPTIEAAMRLFRNPVLLGSGDNAMFLPVLDSYATWRPFLRADALKVLIHFTDATSGNGGRIQGYTGTLDQVLTTMEPAVWGTAGAYQFVYHTFIGLTPNVPPTAPYEPTAPIVGGTCSGSFENAVPLQEMAMRTGGLRFPLCLFDQFGAVFTRIAEAAIARAVVPCRIGVPPPPSGMTTDLATLAVRYRTGAGAESILTRAMTSAECGPDRFTLEADTVVLCPDVCTAVNADPMASLTVLTGCDPSLY